ncbi:MAG: hypothetical protein ACTSP4_06970, partial [Candidatus Hodarchaeales archaeon]
MGNDDEECAKLFGYLLVVLFILAIIIVILSILIVIFILAVIGFTTLKSWTYDTKWAKKNKKLTTLAILDSSKEEMIGPGMVWGFTGFVALIPAAAVFSAFNAVTSTGETTDSSITVLFLLVLIITVTGPLPIRLTMKYLYKRAGVSSYDEYKIVKQFGAPDYWTVIQMQDGGFSDYQTFKHARSLGANSIEQLRLVQETNAPDYPTAKKMVDEERQQIAREEREAFRTRYLSVLDNINSFINTSNSRVHECQEELKKALTRQSLDDIALKVDNLINDLHKRGLVLDNYQENVYPEDKGYFGSAKRKLIDLENSLSHSFEARKKFIERRTRLLNITKKVNSIRLTDLANQLGTSKNDLISWLIELPDEGITIDGDYVRF